MTPKEKRLWRCFRLTQEKWQKLWDYQKGLCAICGKPMKKPNTDHDHLSGEVRGLCCPACNRALGRFRDSLVLLQAAVAYLLSPPARIALGGIHIGLPGRVDTKKQRKLHKQMELQGK